MMIFGGDEIGVEHLRLSERHSQRRVKRRAAGYSIAKAEVM
jgi:hypothetical protein